MTKSNALLIEVPLPSDFAYRSSLITRKICDLPFFGGMYFTISSENNTKPTLSLFLIAENPKTLAISAPISLF